jgi:hypothetical protein
MRVQSQRAGLAAEVRPRIFIALVLVNLTCYSASAPKDECRPLNPDAERGLRDAATAFLQKAAGAAVRLEPLCDMDSATGPFFVRVRTEPVVGLNAVASRYAATCNFSPRDKKWMCKDVVASREIAMEGRSPIQVTWSVEPHEAQNIVEFLTRRVPNAGLQLEGCGSQDHHKTTFTQDELKAITRIFRWDPPDQHIVAQLDQGLQIYFGTAVDAAEPDVRKLCWTMLAD